MKAIEADILAIDFETTGVAKENANLPWQLGVVRIVHGIILPEQSFSLFFNVPADHKFNPYAPGRWASMRDQLAQAPRFENLWPQLSPWLLGRVLMAHHAPTEQSILRHAFPLSPFGPWLDTLDIVRRAYVKLNSYKLEDVIPTLNLQADVEALAPGRAPHDALYDAFACAVLLRHILSLPGWHDADISQL